MDALTPASRSGGGVRRTTKSIIHNAEVMIRGSVPVHGALMPLYSSNAFNSLDRSAMMRVIAYMCPISLLTRF